MTGRVTVTYVVEWHVWPWATSETADGKVYGSEAEAAGAVLAALEDGWPNVRVERWERPLEGGAGVTPNQRTRGR